MGVIAPALNYFDDISDTQQIYIRQTINKAAIHDCMANGEAPYFKYRTYSKTDKKLHVNTMDKETLDWCRSSISDLTAPDGGKFKLWTDSDYDKLHKLKIMIYNLRPEWDAPALLLAHMVGLNPQLNLGVFECMATKLYKMDEMHETRVAREYVFYVDDTNLSLFTNNEMSLRSGIDPFVFRLVSVLDLAHD